MRKLLTLLLAVCALSAYSQDTIVQSNIKGWLDYSHGQILQLAEAFSEDQYDWRPQEGVRSVGETIMHVVSANYFFGSKLGAAPPEDVDMKNLESIKGKDMIIAEFKKSADYVKGVADQVEASTFENEVDFGFMKSTNLGALLLAMEHAAEHKGQLIAYARSNGITPPWSQSQ
jgi:uncharacterized damage-inducible protein DinB